MSDDFAFSTASKKRSLPQNRRGRIGPTAKIFPFEEEEELEVFLSIEGQLFYRLTLIYETGGRTSWTQTNLFFKEKDPLHEPEKISV